MGLFDKCNTSRYHHYLGITVAATIFQMAVDLEFHTFVNGVIIQNGYFWLLYYPLIFIIHYILVCCVSRLYHYLPNYSLFLTVLIFAPFVFPKNESLYSVLCELELPFVMATFTMGHFKEEDDVSNKRLSHTAIATTMVCLFCLIYLTVSYSHRSIVSTTCVSTEQFRLLAGLSISSLLISFFRFRLRHCQMVRIFKFILWLDVIMLGITVLVLLQIGLGYKAVSVPVIGLSLPVLCRCFDTAGRKLPLWLAFGLTAVCYVIIVLAVSFIWKLVL